MTKTRIKIQTVPSRSGKTWSVWANGSRIIASTREPLAEIAQRLLAAGHKREARIVMTRTPAGPCRFVSTIGNAATAAVLPPSGVKDAVSTAYGHPFRAPDWVALHANGGT